MATYAIGDVQGCYQELLLLLEKIEFNIEKDRLWFVGDMINRGPDSLQVLQLIDSLGNRAQCILGNHEFHFLAVAKGLRDPSQYDSFHDILNSSHCDYFVNWLLQQPVLYHDELLGFTMVHAGIHPHWDLKQAIYHAHEVSLILQSEEHQHLLANLWSNEPAQWQDDLVSIQRWRYIINVFTRMRFCDEQGGLNLSFKGEIHDAPDDLIPWFQFPHRKTEQDKLIFGHWAALRGKTDIKNIYAIDTGCAWGEKLTALCLETEKRFSVNALRKI